MGVKELRLQSESSFKNYCCITAPHLLFGTCHYEVMDWLDSNEGKTEVDKLCKLLLLPRGHLKAQRLDCKVMTPTGWSTIGQLNVGDQVIGQDGTPKAVTALHPISKMALWKVRTRDGRETVCNEEHLWNVICPSNTGNKVVTKALKEIQENYKCSRKDKRTDKVYTEYRYFLPTCQPIQYEEKQLLIDPYVLGAWLGDGTSADGSMTSADPEMFEFFPYPVRKQKRKYGYGVLGLKAQLADLGVLGNKHVPSDYFFGSIGQRTALLQGLIDTDGTIQADGKRGGFTNKNESLVDAVIQLVRSLGGTATKGITMSRPNKFVEKKPYYTCTFRMPAGIVPVRLPRKVSQWKGSIKTRSAIVSIERVEDAEARCISVEDELYITDDYMVTHNSKIMALYACYRIVKNPAITILYLSAAQELATAQLKDIKAHLTSRIHLRLWPTLVNTAKKTKKKWDGKHISVDHPERHKRRVRDNTVSALSIESKFVGLHYDICIFDDIVDLANSRSIESRRKLASQVGMITGVLNSNAEMTAAGTIYHPQDIYAGWEAMELPVYDGKEVIGTRKRWDVLKKVVEIDGEFLWPRHSRDGRTEGFDMNVLAEKKADILIDEGNLIQFGCQYYMDPMMEGNSIIKRSMFKYYNRRDLKYEGDRWYYRDEPLKTLVGWDFAEGITKFHDYSVLAVVGLSSANEAYILDLYKYKTQDAAGQFKVLKKAHSKWWFRRVRAEANKAGKQLILEIEKLIKLNGLAIKVDAVTHTSYDGAKEERIGIVLNHRYINGSIQHPKGQGYVGDLEDELIAARPRHDDLKDAVATALEDSKPPVHLAKKKLTTTRYTRRGGLVV